MKRVCILTLSIMLALAMLLPLPVLAEELTTAGETVAEEATVTEPVTEAVTEPVTEPETSDTFAAILEHASPEEMDLIEKIILGGIDNLDKLGLEGYDRVRIWLEYNPTTVMLVAFIIGLIIFIITNILLKHGVSKHSDKLAENAAELYETGVDMQQKAEKVCAEVLERAKQAAEEAIAAHREVSAERALLNRELEKVEIIEQSMTEVVNFLMQCSDLSQAKRDEAENIIKRGKEALRRYEQDGE